MTGNNVVSVGRNKEAITSLAREIASWEDPREVTIWLLAEAQVRMRDALLTPLTWSEAVIEIDPARIVHAPERAEIELLAEKIAADNPTIEELHWLLAEQLFLYRKSSIE